MHSKLILVRQLTKIYVEPALSGNGTKIEMSVHASSLHPINEYLDTPFSVVLSYADNNVSKSVLEPFKDTITLWHCSQPCVQIVSTSLLTQYIYIYITFSQTHVFTLLQFFAF